MSSSIESISRTLLALCAASLLLISAGCAASSTTIIEEEVVTNSKPMYSYTSLVIQDFELKRELYSDSPANGMSQRELRYAKLPGELSDHIERYIKSHRTYKTISRDGKPDASTLLLTGKFKRLGRFKISVVVSLRDGVSGQEVAYFRETLWDVLDTTESISQLGREVADFIDRIQYK
jgi:outer membrane lipoprotein-sorting protein